MIRTDHRTDQDAYFDFLLTMQRKREKAHYDVIPQIMEKLQENTSDLQPIDIFQVSKFRKQEQIHPAIIKKKMF